MAAKYLKPLKGKYQNRKFAVFDIETRNWTEPYAVGFYDGQYHEFFGDSCISDFLNHLLAHPMKYRGMVIYAHNGGKFDFAFLLDVLKKYDLALRWMYQGSRVMKLTMKFPQMKKNRVNFVDSLLLLPYSLDKLTKNFKVMHQKLAETFDGDYEELYQMYKRKDPKFREYLKNDCLGLYEVLMNFNGVIKESGGTVGLTLASTGMNTFRKSCLDQDIPMSSRKMNSEMKKAYFGGRTEIFRMYLPDNGDKYHCYDVNSLYPYVMKNFDYPISEPKINTYPSSNCYRDGTGITECNVIAPKDLYVPVLPIKLDSKLYFPLGRFHGFWHDTQLIKAKEMGYTIKPVKHFQFDTAPIFRNYVDKFFALKLRSKPDTPQYLIAKLLLNSLYGKFAQRQDTEMVRKLAPDEEIPEDMIDYVDLDNSIIRIKSEAKGHHFIPQISIQVTALAQLELYKHMERILDRDGVLAYCDTDSVFTDVTIPTGTKLGEMKKEYDFECGYFLLPKTYYIKNNGTHKVKAKGFPNVFKEKLNEQHFIDAIFGCDVSKFAFETEPQFNTTKTSLRRHGNYVSMDIRKKSIRSIYDKRKILADMDTIPYNRRELSGRSA